MVWPVEDGQCDQNVMEGESLKKAMVWSMGGSVGTYVGQGPSEGTEVVPSWREILKCEGRAPEANSGSLQ